MRAHEALIVLVCITNGIGLHELSEESVMTRINVTALSGCDYLIIIAALLKEMLLFIRAKLRRVDEQTGRSREWC